MLNISTEISQVADIPHPYTGKYKPPRKGRLKWVGGNLALDYPVEEYVIDDSGTCRNFDLTEVLSRLDDFEGFRGKDGNLSIKDYLIDACFSAYEHSLLSQCEREIFEIFVREKIGSIGSLDAARALICASNHLSRA
jgi:hypothetical protein